MSKIRMSVVFFGDVQGVGFRYTANYAAQRYGLTGWVHNEFDGSVACEVQGEPEGIDRWFQTIQSGRFIQIDRIEKRELTVLEDERSFQVWY
jgi:acylphosphatase